MLALTYCKVVLSGGQIHGLIRALLTNLLHESALAPGDDICSALMWVGECLGNLTFTAGVLIDNKDGCCFTKFFVRRGRIGRDIACYVIYIGIFLAIATNNTVVLVANIFMLKFCQHLYVIGNGSTENRHVRASDRWPTP